MEEATLKALQSEPELLKVFLWIAGIIFGLLFSIVAFYVRSIISNVNAQQVQNYNQEIWFSSAKERIKNLEAQQSQFMGDFWPQLEQKVTHAVEAGIGPVKASMQALKERVDKIESRRL